VTLLCCDNLRHNGDRSRSGLVQFIKALGDNELLAWVEKNTTSPNDMVDRITPRRRRMSPSACWQRPARSTRPR